MKNPYEVLGQAQSASQDEIKAAYRNLAKELHPDVNPGDTIVEQRFKEVTAAYEMLSDEGKRAQFDRGEINTDGSPRMDGMFNRNFKARGGADFEDLVADLFGRRRRPRQTKGRSVTYSVRVPFLEAARGGVQRVRLQDDTTVDVNIPSATKDGDSLRLKGRGMPGTGGGGEWRCICRSAGRSASLFHARGARRPRRCADNNGGSGAWRQSEHTYDPRHGVCIGTGGVEQRKSFAPERAWFGQGWKEGR